MRSSRSACGELFAVIPSGPDSTAEAATLSLMLATQEKEELQLGADALGCQPYRRSNRVIERCWKRGVTV